MVGCLTLVEQVVDGKIFREGQEDATPSAENEVEPTKVVETSNSTNH